MAGDRDPAKRKHEGKSASPRGGPAAGETSVPLLYVERSTAREWEREAKARTGGYRTKQGEERKTSNAQGQREYEKKSTKASQRVNTPSAGIRKNDTPDDQRNLSRLTKDSKQQRRREQEGNKRTQQGKPVPKL